MLWGVHTIQYFIVRIVNAFRRFHAGLGGASGWPIISGNLHCLPQYTSRNPRSNMNTIRGTLSGMSLYLMGDGDNSARHPAPEVDSDKYGARAAADAVYSKVSRKILPIFFTMVIFNYIDRTNLAFASIQLNKQLGFTASVYGLGSGLFFLGYGLCQVPSNLVLMRVGAPIWLSVVIVSWGICATCFCTITSTAGFYTLRLLLGVTEAGAFPGMWFYLAQWYPEDRITAPYALMEAAMCLSHTIAAPLAAVLLSFDGWLGELLCRVGCAGRIMD